MSKTYTLPSLLAIFEAAPEEKWNSGSRWDGDTHCALGWIEVDMGGFGHHDPCKMLNIDDPVFALFEPLICPSTYLSRSDFALANINNGEDKRYPQSTPKQRTVAAINDLINGSVPACLEAT